MRALAAKVWSYTDNPSIHSSCASGTSTAFEATVGNPKYVVAYRYE
jgi:hypothetical protein